MLGYGYACYGYACYSWLCLPWLHLLQERASSISRVMDSVLSTVAATCDWAEEARRIAQDEQPLYDATTFDPLRHAQLLGTQGVAERVRVAGGSGAGERPYVMTGSVHWMRASQREREAVVEAFGSNATILAVQMSDCAVNDALACRWAQVL